MSRLFEEIGEDKIPFNSIADLHLFGFTSVIWGAVRAFNSIADLLNIN